MCQLVCEGLDEYLSIDEGAQNRVPDVVLLADTLVKHREEFVGGVNIATIVEAGGLVSVNPPSLSSELHVEEIGSQACNFLLMYAKEKRSACTTSELHGEMISMHTSRNYTHVRERQVGCTCTEQHACQ